MLELKAQLCHWVSVRSKHSLNPFKCISCCSWVARNRNHLHKHSQKEFVGRKHGVKGRAETQPLQKEDLGQFRGSWQWHLISCIFRVLSSDNSTLHCFWVLKCVSTQNSDSQDWDSKWLSWSLAYLYDGTELRFTYRKIHSIPQNPEKRKISTSTIKDKWNTLRWYER